MRRACTLGLAMLAGCGLATAGEASAVHDDASAPGQDASEPDHGSAGANDATDDGVDSSPAADVAVRPDATPAPDASDGPEEEGGSDASTADTGTVSDGNSIAFDGSGAYVDCGDVPIPADFTIEAWVRPTRFGGGTYVLAEDERNHGQGQFRFGFVSGGQLFFYMTDGSGMDYGLYNGQYALVSSSPLPTGTWSEVAVTKAGAAFTLLVGGAQVAAFTASASFAFGNGGTQLPLRIGSRVAANGTSVDGVFSGLIDEVRLWNKARTPAQIQAAMAGEIAPSDPAWSALQDYWPFDEGSGSTTADRSGTHPGTVSGGAAWMKSAPF